MLPSLVFLWHRTASRHSGTDADQIVLLLVTQWPAASSVTRFAPMRRAPAITIFCIIYSCIQKWSHSSSLTASAASDQSVTFFRIFPQARENTTKDAIIIIHFKVMVFIFLQIYRRCAFRFLAYSFYYLLLLAAWRYSLTHNHLQAKAANPFDNNDGLLPGFRAATKIMIGKRFARVLKV